MKRMVLILTIMALILSFSNVSMAQITEKGVKVGLNLASATGDDVKDAKSKTGFAVGGYVLYPLNESVTMQIEALYAQKGVKMEGEETITYYGYTMTYDYKSTINLTYIEIPVLFRYDIQSSGNMKPYIIAGPYIALTMGAKVKWESGDESGSDDIKDDIKGMDYGVILGAGVKVNEKISIDARYSMGLTSVDDSEHDAGDMKNKVISVTAGYALN
ncbi:PorT family protein [candidate division KSB1 bacterium]|nr:PorT family protein [candidate division KSB1 bacterium]